MGKKVQANVKRLERPNPETEDVSVLLLTVNGKEFKAHRESIFVFGYCLAKVDLALLFREGDFINVSLANDQQRVEKAWSGPQGVSVPECLANDGMKNQLKQWLGRRSLNMCDLANLVIGHPLLLRGKVIQLLPARQNACCGTIRLSQSALECQEVFFERKTVSIFGTVLMEHGDLGLLFPLDKSRNCDVRVQCEIRRLSKAEVKVWADILSVSEKDIPVLAATRVLVTGKYPDGGDGSTAQIISLRSWLSSRGLDEDALKAIVLGQHQTTVVDLTEPDEALRSKERSENDGAAKRRRRSSPPRDAPSASEKSTLRKCPVCDVRHDLRDCERFLGLTATEREEVLVRKRHCTLCLEYGHDADDCLLQFDCCYCDVKHNTLLHGSTFKRPAARRVTRERSPERRSETTRRRAPSPPSPPPAASRDWSSMRPSSPAPSFGRHERDEDLWRRQPTEPTLAQRLGPPDESVWQRLAAAAASVPKRDIGSGDQDAWHPDRRPTENRSSPYSNRSRRITSGGRGDADLFSQWEELDGGEKARSSLTASIQDRVRKELDLARFDPSDRSASLSAPKLKSFQPSLSDQLQALMPNGVLPKPVGSVLPSLPPPPPSLPPKPASACPPSAPPSARSGPSAAARTATPMLQQAELLIEQIMSCKTPAEASGMNVLKDQSQLKLAMFIHKTLAISIKGYEELRNLRNPVLDEIQAMNRSRTFGNP